MIRTLFLAAALAFSAATAAAETETPPAPAKPCDTPVHHDFDFWIGEWDVFGPDGTLAGSNSITREEYGCLLLERWTGATGITGQSYNFYDPSTDKWRQVWVSAGAVIDYTGKLDDTGAMRLEGTITYRAGQPPAPFRGEWTPNADGTVTQHFTQQDPATGEWTDWFTGKYVRKSAP
jgi:hypothetical protein